MRTRSMHCAMRTGQPNTAASGPRRPSSWCRPAVPPAAAVRGGPAYQSLRNHHHQDFGFDTTNRYILHIDPQMAGYKVEQIEALDRQLQFLATDSQREVSGLVEAHTPWKATTGVKVSTLKADNLRRPATAVGSSWVRAKRQLFGPVGTRIIAGRPISEQELATTAQRHLRNKPGNSSKSGFHKKSRQPNWSALRTRQTKYSAGAYLGSWVSEAPTTGGRRARCAVFSFPLYTWFVWT